MTFEPREAAFHMSSGATHVHLVTASHAVQHHLGFVFLFRVVFGVGLGRERERERERYGEWLLPPTVGHRHL